MTLSLTKHHGLGNDFLVLLDDAPRDLSGLRLQITASIER